LPPRTNRTYRAVPEPAVTAGDSAAIECQLGSLSADLRERRRRLPLSPAGMPSRAGGGPPGGHGMRRGDGSLTRVPIVKLARSCRVHLVKRDAERKCRELSAPYVVRRHGNAFKWSGHLPSQPRSGLGPVTVRACTGGARHLLRAPRRGKWAPYPNQWRNKQLTYSFAPAEEPFLYNSCCLTQRGVSAWPTRAGHAQTLHRRRGKSS